MVFVQLVRKFIFLDKPNFHYGRHKSALLDVVLSCFPLDQNIFLYLIKININIILRSMITFVKYSITLQTDIFGLMFKNWS
jgi:hypothetical protein